MKPSGNPQLDRAELTRRAFLRKVGMGVAAAFAAQALTVGSRPVQASEAAAPDTPAMLIDLTRCTGCNSCALACKVQNNLPNAEVVPEGLDSDTYTFVSLFEVENSAGESVTRTVKRQCMHCLDPACVAACPAAAMYRSPEGPIVYRANRCLGCRYCQVACPFDVPMFDWENPITAKISKCWFCYDRLRAGEKPACAAACPTGALRFGRRDELLAQAHAQIASGGGRYIDHVFGEHEVGGTSMLYLSDVSFAELGFPTDLPHDAPPEQTHKVMELLPAVIVGVGALAAGTAVYTHRLAPERRTSTAEAEDE
jgi:formate dehydrogenase iron-sulfur subunit